MCQKCNGMDSNHVDKSRKAKHVPLSWSKWSSNKCRLSAVVWSVYQLTWSNYMRIFVGKQVVWLFITKFLNFLNVCSFKHFWIVCFMQHSLNVVKIKRWYWQFDLSKMYINKRISIINSSLKISSKKNTQSHSFWGNTFYLCFAK